jgi:hypothetical protein
MATAYSTGTTWTYTGMVVPAEKGERPKETDDKKLIETRAIQLKDGWVGQVIMAGEIVKETSPKPEADEALEEVNQHILKRFKRMIIG